MNPGPQKTCTACGSPQPDDVQFENMPQQELSTDPSLAEKAKKGADIHCPYCQTRNTADAALCIQCGGDLKGGEQRQAGRVVGAFKTDQVGAKACPTCGTLNPPNNTRCSSCGASMSQPSEQTPVIQSTSFQSPPPVSTAKKRSPLMWIGLISLLCILGVACFALISYLTRTSEVTGTVSALEWKLSINIEQLRPVAHSDWSEAIPASANIDSCQQKVNRVQDYPEGNYEEVCGTPYTVDTGTGIGEVVQDCSYEIYMDYCQYTIQEWTVVDTYTQTGQDANPYWPTVSFTVDQRQGDLTENYTIYFDTEKGRLDYSTHDLTVFQVFRPGSTWLLDVTTLGSISDYRPK
jgi:DNA-directed RNA polymerase subunit RPC12/RpoP